MRRLLIPKVAVALLIVVFLLAAEAQEGPKIPDGVIVVKLPAGALRMETIERDGKPMLQVIVGQTVIEAKRLFVGDGKAGTLREATKAAVGTVWNLTPGSPLNDQVLVSLAELKPPSLYITTPSIVFGPPQKKDAQQKKNEGKEPNLPHGVILVKLPPGEVRMERVFRHDKPILRISVARTVIEAQTVFLGDGKGATHYEAIKNGIHWIPGSGGKGNLMGVAISNQPGSSINEEDFVPLHALRPGSLYLTTPSIVFRWGKDAIPPKR